MSDLWRSASMQRSLSVFAGAAIGAASRFAVVGGMEALGLGTLAGTLTVNLAGAFALGYVVGRRSVASMPATAFSFVAIGLLGSFTTFSAFTFEVYDLFADARAGLAMGYAIASVVVGLVVARGGLLLGERR